MGDFSKLGDSAVRVVDVAVAVAAAPLAFAGVYLGVLSAFARAKPAPSSDLSVRFAIVVPAHNEALSIAETVKNLQTLRYPVGQLRILVVADNCTDDTGAQARDAGAEVIERTDRENRGKGFALACAFEVLLAEDVPVHAVVVVDADTRASSNLLLAFSGRIASGAEAMQASYRVANSRTTWRTALMGVAFACMHDVRSLGRERLRLSTGLRGNGMCFTVGSLRRVPHDATSLVEDVEHGIDLALQGVRVVFVHEAFVEAEMPERANSAASQRERWERGRAQLRRERALPLLRSALRRRDRVQADLSVDLLLPPLSQYLIALSAVGSFATLLTFARQRLALSAVPVALGAVGLACHVGEGWRQSGTGVDGLRALSKVPEYVFWKAGLRTRRSPRKFALGPKGSNAEEWVRTTRNAEDSK